MVHLTAQSKLNASVGLGMGVSSLKRKLSSNLVIKLVLVLWQVSKE